ncbi:uncharacterized protein C8A04DRAFT_26923 [Dichotomopilus funicola]|uniref:Pre-mRNA-splicing factor 38B n=1 Tax=Dichotomopilus funicola TaxID=1934379 RepID=A0AAN6V6L1_9PEZI|nr:hypothetical protein C8A04DRAFT_26923 [Dichotomopilus funicola]
MLTDDAVAELLSREAKDASMKYSSMGLEAFRSTKPAHKAKPNTRFLGRIIKETTNHNAALLAREAAEAQARLDDLTESEAKKRRKLNPSASDLRRRQLGDISSILAGRKPRTGDQRGERPKDKDEEQDNKGRRGAPRERRRSPHAERQEDKEEEKYRSRRRRDDRKSREHGSRHDRSRSPRGGSRRHRHRHRSPLSSSEEEHRSRHSRSHRKKSRQDQDLIGGESSNRRNYGRLREDDDDATNSSKHGQLNENIDDDSDPLDDFIGPAPPSESRVQPRGRGALRGAAAMDDRFSKDYDPSSDIQPQPAATENWDEAVETFRDLQKWKQQGAERLRTAGFTEAQIKEWEKGGQKDIDDVRWSKAGEKREWDRGKEDSET